MFFSHEEISRLTAPSVHFRTERTLYRHSTSLRKRRIFGGQDPSRSSNTFTVSYVWKQVLFHRWFRWKQRPNGSYVNRNSLSLQESSQYFWRVMLLLLLESYIIVSWTCSTDTVYVYVCFVLPLDLSMKRSRKILLERTHRRHVSRGVWHRSVSAGEKEKRRETPSSFSDLHWHDLNAYRSPR